MQSQTLELRDIHQSVAPGFWPPAVGWWWLAAAIGLLMGLLWWRARRRRRYRQALLQLFDETLARAADNPAKVAAISGLLRRAARRHGNAADTLEGEAWLALLNQDLADAPFTGELAALLQQGGFRPEVDAQQLQALQQVAKRRFLLWMGARP
ncbi:hypothetical protein CO613_02265 [Lysobacteraceae bacterium NML07-0707]|nr:hypothetical protein CO613_02265 [Xanthomonadaceae bacterium NML07-0707]